MDKIPVTLRAVLQRLNRQLAQREEVLKKARGAVVQREFGDYYTLNWRLKYVVAHHIDPIVLARTLGLLAAWETVEEPHALPAPELAPDPLALGMPAFDPHKFRLGSLCKHGHAFQDTNQSLRRLVGGSCVECARDNQRKGP